jgi:hypothetical protein
LLHSQDKRYGLSRGGLVVVVIIVAGDLAAAIVVLIVVVITVGVAGALALAGPALGRRRAAGRRLGDLLGLLGADLLACIDPAGTLALT